MSSISRSLSDVPEEGTLTPTTTTLRLDPLSTSASSVATASATPLPTMSAPSSRQSQSSSKSHTPSIRTLGRSVGENVSGSGSNNSHTVNRVPSSTSASATTASTSSKPRKPTPIPSGLEIKTIPTLPHDKDAPTVPSTAMYWSRAPAYGAVPQRTMRAHTMTLVDNIAWLVGGIEDKDSTKDMKDMHCFDTGAVLP
ncbi:hypothetical protein C0995_010233 [Termitomyces sp. Mi166|nr:hypothetical protein C0995_010233 [Termitomyces sp. Mi166\